MKAGARSLLEFLQAPVVVGDPDGHAVYANPAFERRFGPRQGALLGTPLATLFDGGAREGVLQAVAEACVRGRPLRFRIREQGVGFAALASPISEGEARFGVLLLLSEESLAEERLFAYQREIQEPLDELAGLLEGLFEQTGGRRAGRFRDSVEHAMRALDRLRKWTEALGSQTRGREVGGGDPQQRFEPAQAVRNAAESIRSSLTDGRDLDLLVPAELPAVCGERAAFEAALASLLRESLQRAGAGAVTLAARAIGRDQNASVVITLSEAGGAGSADEMNVPPVVEEMVRGLGGTLQSASDPVLGRTTAIRLPLAS